MPQCCIKHIIRARSVSLRSSKGERQTDNSVEGTMLPQRPLQGPWVCGRGTLSCPAGGREVSQMGCWAPPQLFWVMIMERRVTLNPKPLFPFKSQNNDSLWVMLWGFTYLSIFTLILSSHLTYFLVSTNYVPGSGQHNLPI